MDLQIIDPNQEKYALLLELLTPVAKTFGAEYGQASVNQSLQIFGGYWLYWGFPFGTIIPGYQDHEFVWRNDRHPRSCGLGKANTV